MTVDERIEQALIRFLAAEHNIIATNAYLDDTEYHESYGYGCDTCGYRSDESSFSFDIRYRSDGRYNTLTVDGDPLGFMPTLFKYDTEN